LSLGDLWLVSMQHSIRVGDAARGSSGSARHGGQASVDVEGRRVQGCLFELCCPPK
jgi:hypothetical protein